LRLEQELVLVDLAPFLFDIDGVNAISFQVVELVRQVLKVSCSGSLEKLAPAIFYFTK